MKVVKLIGKIVGWTLAAVVVLALAIPVWFGPVGKLIANNVVPGVVKTDFSLKQLALNPYKGRFELGELKLSNPEGYPEQYAATVGELVVDVEATTLASEVIHVEEITIKDVFVSVVNGGENNVGNFTQIKYNVAGGKEAYETKQAEKAEAEKSVANEPKKERKVIIDRLQVSGIKVMLGFFPIVLPSITLTDIGKKSNGATLEELWAQIVTAVMGTANAMGDGLNAASMSILDAADMFIGGADDSAKEVEKSAKKMFKSFKGLLKKKEE